MNDLTQIIQTQKRNKRTITPNDLKIMLDLIAEHQLNQDTDTIRVYPDNAFVPRSYKWRATTQCLHATRNKIGDFDLQMYTVDAHRPNGQGPKVTINGR